MRLKSCTTFCAGKDATSLGYSITGHSDDNELGDSSIVYVPAKDYPYSEFEYCADPHDPAKHLYTKTEAHWGYRNVYLSADAVGEFPKWNCFLTPRLNIPGYERSPNYFYGPEFPQSIPLGCIPQVPHTYAYLDGAYGIINEWGLSFGECTNGTIFECGPTDSDDGSGKVKRLFYSSELSRLALERCQTAREAVILMGRLIDIYGYYGTGETLPIADGTKAWMFEMYPSKTGTGGYWAAIRIPDNEICWASNESVIQEIKADGEKQHHYEYVEGKYRYIVGKQIFKDFNLQTLNFEATCSNGEYNRPRYSRLRRWRAMDKCAPSLHLNPDAVKENPDGTFNTGLNPYPLSIIPDKPLSLNDIFAIYRDHYEGTKYDLTKPGDIDPWGNPNRYNTHGYDSSGDVGTQTVNGGWNRSISWYYTGYTFVNTPNPDMVEGLKGLTWMALNVPGESCFVPLNVGEVPLSYAKINAGKFDEGKAWWIYNRVAEECYKKYSLLKPEVEARQKQDEENSQKLVNDLKAQFCPDHTPGGGKANEVQKILGQNARDVQAHWKDLWYKLIVKYNQGFKYENGEAYAIGYPPEWLENSKWRDGPVSYDQPYNGTWTGTQPGTNATIDAGIYAQVLRIHLHDGISIDDNLNFTIGYKPESDTYFFEFGSTVYSVVYDKATDTLQWISGTDTINFTRSNNERKL